MASASGLKSCSVGIKVGDNCHHLSYCRKPCIYNTTELDKKQVKKEQVKIMKRRAGIEKLDTACHHHLTIFFQQYESLQKTCFDSINHHTKQFCSTSITFS